MNNRRWYPVSRLAPEQIKVLKHSMDPSMTVLLPGVETATAYGCKLVSYHRGGEDQSRVDLDLPVALVVDPWTAAGAENSDVLPPGSVAVAVIFRPLATTALSQKTQNLRRLGKA